MENCEKKNEKKNEKHNCPCGGHYITSNKARHELSKKHSKYLVERIILRDYWRNLLK